MTAIGKEHRHHSSEIIRQQCILGDDREGKGHRQQQKQDGLLFFASINKNACIAKRTVFLDRFPLVKQGG